MELVTTKLLLEQDGDKFKLKSTVSAIEAADKDQESGLVIGQCKALIESLCKSMMDLYGSSYDPNINFHSLAKSAVKQLELGKNAEAETKTKEAFVKLVTSFAHTIETATNAIGSLRNDYCPLAHGRSINHKPLHIHYSNYVLAQTDALVSFILVLIGEKETLEPQFKYEDNSDFNDNINEVYDQIEIFGDTYLPSEIVFNLNPDKYKIALVEYNEEQLGSHD